jgi:hypothetical protein
MIKQTLKHGVVCTAILTGTFTSAIALEHFTPKKGEKVPYKVSLTKGGAVNVSLGKQSYVIDSQFSLIPGWAELKKDTATGFKGVKLNGLSLQADGGDFSISRKLIKRGECIEVVDILTNKTNKNVPVMVRHQMKLGKVKELRLCGYKQYSRRARNTGTKNPTTIIMPKTGGSLGMLAISDVFRVHFMGYGIKGVYGIADNDLVLGPKKTIEMRWALFPSKHSNYYAQVNAMRRFLKVNYTIKGGFAFLSPYKNGVKTFDPKYDRIGIENTIEELREFYNIRSTFYSCAGAVRGNGEQSHGSAWIKTRKQDIHLKFYKMLRKADPKIQLMHYFHCYLDVKNFMDKDFPKCKTLTPSGKQADYRNPNYPLYLPTITNAWGKVQDEHLNLLLDEYKVNGIFWDEFTYSASKYHYGEPWDGYSGDIDKRNHKLTRKKSSVTLLSMPWRMKAVNEIIKRKKFLITNGGGGATETMLKVFNKHQFIGFVETGSVSNCLNAQLQTPIGLGDHVTERNEIDCYRNMVKQLEYGCVYFWYHQQVMPITHPTLTQHMFPITPVELHNGYILAKERILTMKSGWFSFGGLEKVKAHFYNKDGFEVKRKLASKVKDNKRFFKVELAEFESCAIVKK